MQVLYLVLCLLCQVVRHVLHLAALLGFLFLFFVEFYCVQQLFGAPVVLGSVLSALLGCCDWFLFCLVLDSVFLFFT